MKSFVALVIFILISNAFAFKSAGDCNCKWEIEDLRKENTDRQIEIGLLREQDEGINLELTNIKIAQANDTDDLNKKYNDLKAQHDDLKIQFNDLKSQYEDFTVKHEQDLTALRTELVNLIVSNSSTYIII